VLASYRQPESWAIASIRSKSPSPSCCILYIYGNIKCIYVLAKMYNGRTPNGKHKNGTGKDNIKMHAARSLLSF
jgi:prepilin signal peptidase PulO-like enzyme (type II secretory pathway)